MSSLVTPAGREPAFPRIVATGSVGLDVAAHKRAVHRLLEAGGLADWADASSLTRRTFGPYFATHVRRARERLGLPAGATVDRVMYAALRREHAYDPLADHLLEEYLAAHPRVTLVYPHERGGRSSVCQGLHPTAGLLGNWAIDFCAPGGTRVLAVEAAKVVKLSGHDPRLGDVDRGAGIFGWSIHYATTKGYRWFSTHYGTREVELGEPLEAGTVLGRVGSWPGDPGRSHTHLGVTSPLGSEDARRRVTLVANATRVQGVA